MDENEELYRFMNEEDPFYMGPPTEEPSPDRPYRTNNDSHDNANSGGCAPIFLILILAIITFLL